MTKEEEQQNLLLNELIEACEQIGSGNYCSVK